MKEHYIPCGTKMVKDKTGNYVRADVYQDNDTPILRELAEKYPDAYEALDKNIFHNENSDIRKMGIRWLAKPKNPNIPVPDWFYDFVDMNGIVSDVLKLYNPILTSIGVNVAKISSTESHYTNMVSL